MVQQLLLATSKDAISLYRRGQHASEAVVGNVPGMVQILLVMSQAGNGPDTDVACLGTGCHISIHEGLTWVGRRVSTTWQAKSARPHAALRLGLVVTQILLVPRQQPAAAFRATLFGVTHL
jgi:hypothetical protein